jgi:hypothetical protein
MASYLGGVGIVVDGAIIETGRAQLQTQPPSPTGRIDWGGLLWPSAGRLLFNTAFLELEDTFTIRLRDGREARVMKRNTVTQPGTQQRVEILHISGEGVPF